MYLSSGRVWFVSIQTSPAWAACETDEQRLDVFNGLLLAAHWDAAFDAGLVSFDEGGKLMPGPQLPTDALQMLAGARALTEIRIAMQPQHAPFMRWHRECVFLRA